jgi:hypothetical protein
MLVMLAAIGLLSGCYYDPGTGLTYAYPPPYRPPPYGYPVPGAVAPAYGEPPADGGPQGYGEAAPQAYAEPPPAYAEPPPAYGAPPPAYSAAPQGYGAPAGWITRDQYIQQAMQRATATNRDPQQAAQHAGAVFDEIDVNHTGVLTRAQIRAWQQAHAHPAGADQPPAEYR